MTRTFETNITIKLDLEVYDETLGVSYEHEFEIHNVPVSGWEKSEPRTHWHPGGVVDGETEIDLDMHELIDLIEEQDDGKVLGRTRFLIEDPEFILAVANERAAESSIPLDV